MLARVLIIVVVNTAFLAAVLWLVPIEAILAARGYTPAQIAALQTAAEENDAAATGGAVKTPSAAADSATSQKRAKPTIPNPPKLVATTTVNVRTGRGTKHDIVGQVTAGEVVKVLKNPGGDWIRIQHGSLRGWTYRPLFKPVTE